MMAFFNFSPVQTLKRGTGGLDTLGQLLGSGLSSGINRVIEGRDIEKGLQAIGYTPDDARKLSFIHPSLLKQIIQQGTPQSQQYLNQIMGKLYGGNQEMQGPQDESLPMNQMQVPQPRMSDYVLNRIKNAGIERLLNPSLSPLDQADQIFSALKKAPYQDMAQDIMQQAARTSERVSAVPQKENRPFEESKIDWSKLSAAQKIQLQNILDEKSKKEAAQLKMMREESRELRKERAEAFKETKKDRQSIIEGKRTADEQLRTLEEMDRLNREGKLDTPGYVEALKRSGLDIPSLMSDDSQVFQKYAQTFLRGAKEIFGSRITDNEVNQFLKMVPSLVMSPEGRKRLIADWKYIARAKVERYNAMRDVIKEERGIPPLDLLEKVEERTDKRLNKIAEKFKDDITKPVPKGQNPLITALMASAGSIASVPGLLLGGASNIGHAAGLAKLLELL